MFEPTRRDVDESVEASIDLFKRAQVGEVAPIVPRRPEHLLLVLDNSSQDRLAEVMAAELKGRWGCTLSVLDAREDVATNTLAEAVAERLQATAVPKPAGDSYQQILEVATASGCDLIVVPCPYGRDLEVVGADSAGTVIDVLLARSPASLLVIRKPLDVERENMFERLRFVLIGENEAAPFAAAWAAGLIAPGGRLHLALILEREFFEGVKAVLEALDPEASITPELLSSALAKTQMRLHRALQKTATEEEFDYDFDVFQDTDPRVRALEDESAGLLLVLALERADHASQGHVQDRIRLSPHPVLVVPVGEPAQ